MTDTNREKWIDDVTGSIQGMHRARPVDGFYERVLNNMAAKKPSGKMPVTVVRWAAAAAIMLLALNIASITHITAQNRKKSDFGNTNPVSMVMQSDVTYNY